MAAFTPPDPDDRAVFDAHLARIRTAPGTTLRAITCDGRLAGTVSSFVADGQTEVTYWIGRADWGRGIASRALELLMGLVTVRPLHARVATDNVGSRWVLEKADFVVTGTERSFATGRNSVIEELILRRD